MDLTDQFRLDPRELYNEKGELLALSDMTPRARKSLRSITQKTHTYSKGVTSKELKVEVGDKLVVGEKLMRHLGGYEKDNKQKEKIIVTDENRNERIAALEARIKKGDE